MTIGGVCRNTCSPFFYYLYTETLRVSALRIFNKKKNVTTYLAVTAMIPLIYLVTAKLLIIRAEISLF
jgi:hypothetical protein